MQRVRFPHPCFYFHPDKPRDRGGKSVFMVLKYLCEAALNKAGCVPLHYPAGALSSPFKLENPRVKLRFTNLAEDQICGAWVATIKMALTGAEWLSQSLIALKKWSSCFKPPTRADESTCLIAQLIFNYSCSKVGLFICFSTQYTNCRWQSSSFWEVCSSPATLGGDTPPSSSLLFRLTFQTSRQTSWEPANGLLLCCSDAHFIHIPSPPISLQMKMCVIGCAGSARGQVMTLLFVLGARQRCSNASSNVVGKCENVQSAEARLAWQTEGSSNHLEDLFYFIFFNPTCSLWVIGWMKTKPKQQICELFRLPVVTKHAVSAI